MNEATTLADRYLAAWSEPDADARLALVAATYTEDATYLDPLVTGEGHQGIADMIGAVHAQFPGIRFRRTGDVEEHHSRVRFTWEVAMGDDDALKGTDVAIVENGRFRDVIGFIDQAPAALLGH